MSAFSIWAWVRSTLPKQLPRERLFWSAATPILTCSSSITFPASLAVCSRTMPRNGKRSSPGSSRCGQMRGHSKREDNAAWIIKVEAIVGRKPQELEQAHFSSTFTKQRNGSLQITRDWDFQTTPDGVIQRGCEEKDF